jgi:Undecaprenyl-phosphate galactose phosphotransferase WbaP
MSTATMAPERIAAPPPAEPGGRWRPSLDRNPLEQPICVLILVLADVLAIAISLRLAILSRAALLPLVNTHISRSILPFQHYLHLAWLWLPLVVFMCVEGLYTQRRTLWSEIAHLTKAIALGFTATFAALALVQRGTEVSRSTILLTAVILLIAMPTMRYWNKRVLGAIGIWHKRILILGSTSTARLAMRGLESDPVLGYEVAGLLDDDPSKIGRRVSVCRGRSVFVLGSLADVSRQMDLTATKDILIAMPNLQEDRLLALVHNLQQRCESIYVVPQLWCLPMMNLRVDGFLRERLMMLKLSNNLAKPWNIWLKRTFDLALGFVLALLALPLCLILAALVKLDSKGAALFVQERLGYRGSRFRCIKFRTMHVEGDEMLTRHLERDPVAADEWRRYAKLRVHDPRLTRLGHFLRRWSLDEVPQLWNVLKGDMSLVGPRPYLLQERGRIGVDLVTILSSRPGMTGFWQVSGRNELTLDDRIQVEAWYVRNWTVWFDCIILAKTFRAVLFPRNGCEPDNAVTDFAYLDSEFVPPVQVSSNFDRQQREPVGTVNAHQHGD